MNNLNFLNKQQNKILKLFIFLAIYYKNTKVNYKLYLYKYILYIKKSL